jgi:hypothetical protein
MVYFYGPFFPCTNCEGRRYVALSNFPLFQLPQIRIFSRRRTTPTPSTCVITFKQEIKFNAHTERIQLLFCLGFVRYHAVSEGERESWICVRIYDKEMNITSTFHVEIFRLRTCYNKHISLDD